MKINFEGTLAEFYALFGHGERAVVRASADTAPTPSVTESEPAPVADKGPTTISDSGWQQPWTEGEPFSPIATRDALPLPPEQKVAKVELPELGKAERELGWQKLCEVCLAWVDGFEDPEAVQPDRVSLIQSLGSGPWVRAVLVMAYEIKSLQRLVEKALVTADALAPARYESEEAWLDYVDRVAANMVQVSHFGFPDLAGTYDYSTAWRRA